jgi:UDP-N-acetylmuramate dehydrogenase
MNILQQVSLADYSTMRLGGAGQYLVEATNRMEVLEALSWAQVRNLPVIMIGAGSNIFWRDEGFAGLVIVNRVMRYELFEEDELNVYLTLGAGENWDSAVERSVTAGLSGIEALSLIPGTCGATPIQNVGAYGQEIAQTITTIEAFDVEAKDFVTIPATDCDFGYRTSRFKTEVGRFYITAITLHLTKSSPQSPFYPAVANYFREHNITEITPVLLRQAVITVRREKLPDPSVIANNGSFFANPVVSQSQLVQIQADNGDEVPHWPTQEGLIKLSAAWLIDQAGFKDFHDQATGIATWPKQSLVLINEHATSTQQLLNFQTVIVNAVAAKFAVNLQREPELLPAIDHLATGTEVKSL